MEDYLVLYGERKLEDLICFLNMFPNAKKIQIGWTKKEEENNQKFVFSFLENQQNIKQILFLGLETGWNKLIKTIKSTYPEIIIKVICTTLDSLLYYDYERENFFTLLKLNKAGIVDYVAFLRKGEYELYQTLGYSCCYLMENYQLDDRVKKELREIEKVQKKQIMSIGIYPLSYTWDKNIFNQLCIGKFIENSEIRYLALHERMQEFLETMQIANQKVEMDKINDEVLLREIIKSDIVIDCSFTAYFHPVFFMSMELGIPCLIGNQSDLFEGHEELEKYVVTNAEDNPIVNAKLVNKIRMETEKIVILYKDWKEHHNRKAEKIKQEFLKLGRK